MNFSLAIWFANGWSPLDGDPHEHLRVGGQRGLKAQREERGAVAVVAAAHLGETGRTIGPRKQVSRSLQQVLDAGRRVALGVLNLQITLPADALNEGARQTGMRNHAR